jgi:UDP:flavonoid glycosyltransferase YjiC (YdhE family)
LLKKPKDWGPEIYVAGFYSLPKDISFEPPADLWSFINAGEPPIYIGFGSIIFDDPQAMMEMILAAVEQAGVRALISRGWARLGTEGCQAADNVFVLGDVPHSWLFEHVSAVIHHGGAGTTAAGLAAGKPTVIVPFFGDVSVCI